MGYFPPNNIAGQFLSTDALANVWLVNSPGTTAPTLSGTNNVFAGPGNVGALMTDGYSNVFMGYAAARDAARTYESVIIGEQAGLIVGSAGRQTFLGSLAGANHSGTTGVSNTYLGRAAGNHDTNGGYNVGVGHAALYYLVGDYNDGVTFTGSYNTAVGDIAGEGVSGGTNTGNYNCYFGLAAGVGTTIAWANQSGSNNVYIGANSSPTSATQRSNVTCVGYGSGAGGDNVIAIGYLAVNTTANSALIGQSGQAMKLGVGTIPSFSFDCPTNSATDGADGWRMSYTGSDSAFTSFGPVMLIRSILAAGSTVSTFCGSYMTAAMSTDPLQYNASQIGTKITTAGTRANSVTALIFKAKAAGSTGLPTVEDCKMTGGVISAMQAGGGFAVKEGSNCRMGVATLSGGTIVVSTTQAVTGVRIFLNHATLGGTPGHLTYTISTGVSFTITSSSGADTSTVNWHIVAPAA